MNTQTELSRASPFSSISGSPPPEPDETLYPLFVYGTLKAGHNRSFLDSCGYFRGDALTVDNTLQMLGWGFPAVVQHNQVMYQIKGELWYINRGGLVQTDSIEGTNHTPPLYDRRTMEVALLDGTRHAAYIYMMTPGRALNLGFQDEHPNIITTDNTQEWSR